MRLKRIKREHGISLLETIVALGLLGIIGVGLLSGLATTSTARVTADEHASAKILAENVLEHVKKQPYATSYSFTVPDGFAGYTANITVTNMKNSNIQKVNVAVWHHNGEIMTLESYKVKRDTT